MLTLTWICKNSRGLDTSKIYFLMRLILGPKLRSSKCVCMCVGGAGVGIHWTKGKTVDG